MVSRVTALHRGLLLYGLLTLTASQTVTEYYAVIGDPFTLPLDYKPLNKDDELNWKHGDTVILRRKRNAFSWGKKEDIDAAGSLTLKDLKSQNAGVYTAEVYDSDGKRLKVWTGKLHILEKVNKPTVKYDCPTGKSTSVSFTCVAPPSQGLTFSWTLNGKDLGGKSSHTLQKSLSELESVGKVTCMVKNKANKQESSDAITPTCKEGFPDLFGFGFWPMVAILAAGGGLALLLLITTLVCCCRAKHRNQRRQEENEELRLQWSQQQPAVDPLPTPSQQRRPRHPIPRATGQAAAQPRTQASNRPPQACSNEEEEEAPPLPRPRKKKHHNPQQQC